MKEKMNQMFKDKLFLVMLVLGLLTIVAAAGVVRMQSGDEQQNPYVDLQGNENLIAGENADGQQPAGPSNAQPSDSYSEEKLAQMPDNPDTAVQEQTYALADSQTAGDNEAEVQSVGSGAEAATALVLDFADTSKMAWPLQGNVLLDYSMDSTIYFPTLEQYKCNPGLVIQGEVSSPVLAPANARVVEQGMNEEIGNYLTLDLGNGYTVVCGQLKEIVSVEGEYLEKGQLLGYLAEPTKYYSVEGSNLYLQMSHQQQPVDPLDYLE